MPDEPAAPISIGRRLAVSLSASSVGANRGIACARKKI
jgi:hypothetical protein